MKQKRRVFCIGAPKTGTHSIAAMFEDTVLAAHEPEPDYAISLILEYWSGKITKANFHDAVRQRVERLNLTIDSSTINLFLLEPLVQDFSNSYFILTIRDCYTWLNS